MDIPTEPQLNPEEPTPTPRRSGVGRSALLAASGAFVALGLITGLGVVSAGAQADPEVVPASAEEATEADVEELDGDEDVEVMELDELDGDIEVIDLEDDPAWAAYDQCVTDALAAAGIDLDAMEAEFEALDADAEITEPTEAELAELDAVWSDVDAQCESALPEDVKAEIEAWKPYDECIESVIGTEDDAFGEVVWLSTADGDVAVEFGTEPGTLTIGGTADAVEIVQADGVTVLDADALDAKYTEMDEAFAACDDLLPEGAEFEMFEDLDDEALEGELLLD